MLQIELIRFFNESNRTVGILKLGEKQWYTLEPGWKGNLPEVSCIPEGLYTMDRQFSPKFGNTFEVQGVERRSHILFHKGNTLADTHGCILVGEEFSPEGIAASAKGYQEFMSKLDGLDEFVLRITEA